MDRISILSFLVLLVLSILFYGPASSQRGDITPTPEPRNNFCSVHSTCSECLQHAGCVWCAGQDFLLDGKPRARCNLRDRLTTNFNHPEIPFCSHIVDSTDPGSFNVLKNDSLSQNGKQRQIRPQRIRIQTGPHKPIHIPVRFTRVKDYPVDLYYIMDLSTSMQDDKEKLVNLAALLANTMNSITDDFQMGFGSFIDKPIAPFTSEAQLMSRKDYQPYLFKHHLKLSKDAAATFAAQVTDAKTFDNLDLPEGGLEALMQAVLCTKNIGWRNESHRLIIFSTDGPYHLAGDGKLAGITVPNDETCHTFEDSDHRFFYKHFRKQDYPSVAQISRQITRNSMNVIFAVPQPVAGIYRSLSDRIPGSSVGELTEDSSNVVGLIEEQYSKITSSVELSHRVTSDAVQVTYSSSCLTGSSPVSTSRCDRIRAGSVVDFNVTIVATNCPNGRNFKEEIQIYPVGVNEALVVELDVICECPCDKVDLTRPTGQDEECHKEGTFQCGHCECNEGFSGPKCECNAQGRNPNSKGCKPDNSTTGRDCNGWGICICDAHCQCHQSPSVPSGKKVWGDFCECNDFDCPLGLNGQVCSGPNQGSCPCNSATCKCEPGWQGEKCDCSTSNEGCINPDQPDGKKEVCSGKGACNCNKCADCVRTEDGLYTGDYCEISPSRCEELRDCVRCKAFQTGPLTVEECHLCEFHSVSFHDEVAETEEEDKLCSVKDESNCNFFFVYNRRKLESVIRVREKKECTDPPNVVAIVSGVAGAILAIGLMLLLLWKILTTIHDRLEYARFQRERALARWDRGDNPIYKRPTTVFLNPAYTKTD